ncbi:unnamed protein product [Acanthoscelides obtectus]|uniref:Uncharacterized protein n=1 Tax=Acanthoscelides obtectus TaxID=200917 RepID=A0A9P0Q3L2_ACAOB|nr:unnamed protein product [Acanthoscelides obtectus]CAK1649183.1 hypothetical protein AOBTE_LOCUS16087 [Acanthoscelides obtectus]
MRSRTNRSMFRTKHLLWPIRLPDGYIRSIGMSARAVPRENTMHCWERILQKRNWTMCYR